MFWAADSITHTRTQDEHQSGMVMVTHQNIHVVCFAFVHKNISTVIKFTIIPRCWSISLYVCCNGLIQLLLLPDDFKSLLILQLFFFSCMWLPSGSSASLWTQVSCECQRCGTYWFSHERFWFVSLMAVINPWKPDFKNCPAILMKIHSLLLGQQTSFSLHVSPSMCAAACA